MKEACKLSIAYTVSQKMSNVWLTITLTYTNQFW